jgi:hypothetical protein
MGITLYYKQKEIHPWTSYLPRITYGADSSRYPVFFKKPKEILIPVPHFHEDKFHENDKKVAVG